MPDRLLAPLLALMRLRRVGVIEARRDLVARLDAQSATEQAVVAIERRMAHEAGIAAAATGSDAMVEAYGRWLGRPGVRLQRQARIVTAPSLKPTLPEHASRYRVPRPRQSATSSKSVRKRSKFRRRETNRR